MLIALLMGVFLFGCKDSDVLTEHIEDPENGVLDETAEPILKHNPDAPEVSELVSAVLSVSNRIDEQIEEEPQFDEDPNDDDQTEQREHKDDSDDKENATKGTKKSDKEDERNDETGDQDQQNENEAGTDQDENQDDGTNEEPQQETGEGKNDGEANAGPGGTGKTYDPSGEAEELPEVGSLAAPGQYATIVQMLAGEGGLRATSSSWVADMHAYGAFENEEYDGDIDGIATPWSGDAASGYMLDVDALIEAAPDAVLVDNVDVILSDDEAARLQDAKIDMIIVPSLGSTDTSDEDIVSAVAIVGQCLSTAETKLDTSAQVTNYNAMHDEGIQNCLSANGGYSYKVIGQSNYAGIYQGTGLSGQDTTYLSSTRFVTAFADSVTHALNSTAVANRSYSSEKMDFLNGETVDASNGIALSMPGLSDKFALIDYYLQVAGVMDNSFDGAKPSGDPAIILPGYAENLIPSSLVGSYSFRNTYSALWFKVSDSQWATVGDQAFPGVLARSADIAQAIAQSAGKSNGIYNVGQPYFVRVVPTGVAGSWATGTVESFLLAPWAFGVFQAGDVAGTCDSYADGFYDTFYRISDASSAIADYDNSYSAG